MRLPFPNPNRIALVVRDKRSRDHSPPDEGHADCILPCGAPVGFFVDAAVEDGWSGRSGATIGIGPSGSASTVIGEQGGVYTYPLFRSRRGYYVNQSDAISRDVVSGVLVINVTRRQAGRFRETWLSMRSNPGTFRIFGNNCSTHAALAFANAGLVNAEIPGLDTPDNLFHALLSQNGGNCEEHYGYLGFEPIASTTDPMDLPCTVDLMRLLSSAEVAELRRSAAARRGR